MNYQDLNLAKLSKLTSHQVDHVTCLECCKYYIAPATAACGHSLCHTCWRGRRTCPVCTTSLDRKAIKLNLQLQNLTVHIQALGEAFEKLFNIKLDEFTLDTQGEIESEKDPNKNVKDWLTSSQNNFSAPLTHSQQSSQAVQQEINPLEISASNIQIHTHVKKTVTPPKVVHVPPPQDDWDKIEQMPDPDKGNHLKENVVGPMDIEPFLVDDTEYTLDNPRRSSRKREVKNDDSTSKTHDLSTTKQRSRDSSADNDKKFEKNKQNWNNVKKMRKEFSKLNKKNKSKLNVSIEMVKKTQNFKATHAVSVNTPQQMLNIDENTPNNENKENEINKEINLDVDKNHVTATCPSIPKPYDKTSDKVAEKSQDNLSADYGDDNMLIANDAMYINNNEIYVGHTQENNISTKNDCNNKDISTHIDINKNQNSNYHEIRHTKMPFIKKSTLLPKSEQMANIGNDYGSNNKATSVNKDDIEITIKIGNTIANIVIKQKESDVQIKVNTDREVQTSLGNHGSSNEQSDNNRENSHKVAINLHTDTSKVPEPASNIPNTTVQTVSNRNKSASTKKNTASADTVTAQFEITESVEKELSNVMECEETPDEAESKKKSVAMKTPQDCKIQEQDQNLDKNEIDEINDLDIFGSGSIKEASVQLLKEHAPSEILISTARSKFKTQKIPEKRNRDIRDDDALPTNKKLKITQDLNLENNVPDSESMNYDAVMDQVFANIDADIEDIRKSQQDQKANNLKSSEHNSIIAKEQAKSIISGMQKHHQHDDPHLTNLDVISNFNDCSVQKHSENVFSMMEKEDDIYDVHKNDKIPEQMEELLTPVLCRTLNSSQDSQPDLNRTSKSTRKSIQDNYDSDKSVVEETPQKNVSFPKLKRASTSSREMNQSQINLMETKKIPSKSSKSIINLTDTVTEANKSSRDVTVIDTAAKKQTLDTPLTITKFADQIKHKSTPVARKSLNFDNENLDDDDPEQTLCPSSVVAKTTQEKEFLRKAFEKTPTSMIKPLSTRKIDVKANKKLCLAGSCLPSQDIARLKYLCNERNWTYVDKYTKDITHLVVGVDEENRSQRSVKYMCALAASKWIVSFEWVKKCIINKDYVDEEHFEALDSTGEPGPRRSRIAKQKLFQGITFYCMPPFSVLDVDTLKMMLVASGGRVVNEIKEVRVTPNSCNPALLLAEPEHTQEDRFIYLTMELSLVPVNYEWVLNCLGSYTLGSIQELLLCPSSLLPPATSSWPEVLITQDD